MIYLDNNATTQPSFEYLEKSARIVYEDFANPSSTHFEGEKARSHIEDARSKIAKSINCKPGEVYFTSGGTEANNIALAKKMVAVIASETDHSSIYEKAMFKIRVETSGEIDLDALSKTANDYKSALIATLLVNNETGVIQPTQEIRSLCEKFGIQWHIDAVQAWGKHGINCDVKDLGCDTMSLSAHKVHGFKGLGALYVKDGIKTNPLFRGGSHERGIRPGTENIFGIVHLGVVVDVWIKNPPPDLSILRDRLENKLSKISQINGSKNRVGSTSNLWFPDVRDLDLFLMKLGDAGIMASGKSACSSGMSAPSRVIMAMFGEDSARLNGSIRLSLSKNTTEGEIDQAAETIQQIVRDGC